MVLDGMSHRNNKFSLLFSASHIDMSCSPTFCSGMVLDGMSHRNNKFSLLFSASHIDMSCSPGLPFAVLQTAAARTSKHGSVM